MIDDEILNREIDGENSSDESARLREELGREPELRARYERLQGVVRTLGAVPPAEPPAGLTAQIMRAVRAKARPVHGGWAGWGEAVRAALVRRPALGFGTALAAGLVLGAFLAGKGEPLRLEEKSGGMMLPAGGQDLREVDRALLAGEGYRGEAVVRAAPGWVEVRVRVEGPPPLDLVATFDPLEFSPLGFDLQGAPAGQVVLGPDSLHVREAGAGDYVFRLAVRNPGSSGVQVRLGRDPASGAFKALKVKAGS
jgi:hypothetical protein